MFYCHFYYGVVKWDILGGFFPANPKNKNKKNTNISYIQTITLLVKSWVLEMYIFIV